MTLTADQSVWTMVTSFLTNYSSSNVFMAFQNNNTLPQVDDFIIITRRNIRQVSLPYGKFDIDNQEEVYYGHGDWEYQIDLYGNNSDDSANRLYTYLNSRAASDYLFNLSKMGIGKLFEAKNLTRVNDRDRYMKRYMLLFTVLNNSKIQIPTVGIAEEDIIITLQEQT